MMIYSFEQLKSELINNTFLEVNGLTSGHEVKNTIQLIETHLNDFNIKRKQSRIYNALFNFFNYSKNELELKAYYKSDIVMFYITFEKHNDVESFTETLDLYETMSKDYLKKEWIKKFKSSPNFGILDGKVAYKHELFLITELYKKNFRNIFHNVTPINSQSIQVEFIVRVYDEP